MSDQVQHTPGAIRAAERIYGIGVTVSREELAQIIHNETGLRELLEAAKEALISLDMLGDEEKTTFAGQSSLRAAIARVEEKTS